MSTITKKVTRNIPNPRQFWNTASDLNDNNTAIATGDIFKIYDSLFGSAKVVVVTTTSASTISFRTNSQITLYPSRPLGEMLYDNNQIIASGVTATDASQGAIVLAGNSSITLNGQINDLQLVTMSGAFTLRAER